LADLRDCNESLSSHGTFWEGPNVLSATSSHWNSCNNSYSSAFETWSPSPPPPPSKKQSSNRRLLDKHLNKNSNNNQNGRHYRRHHRHHGNSSDHSKYSRGFDSWAELTCTSDSIDIFDIEQQEEQQHSLSSFWEGDGTELGDFLFENDSTNDDGTNDDDDVVDDDGTEEDFAVENDQDDALQQGHYMDRSSPTNMATTTSGPSLSERTNIDRYDDDDDDDDDEEEEEEQQEDRVDNSVCRDDDNSDTFPTPAPNDAKDDMTIASVMLTRTKQTAPIIILKNIVEC